MIRHIDPSTERFLNDLSRTSRRIETAQRQITSGKRLNTVSDDPANITSLLATHAQVGWSAQLRLDLGRFKTEVDTAENAMQQAVKLMERARVLATQGTTVSATPEMRAVLAQEAGTLLQQMVGIANTTVEGRFVFSGDSDQIAPYTLDLSLSSPISSYAGTPATRQALHPSGITFAVSRSAQEIFDSSNASENVFSALNDLRLALAANDSDAIRAAIPEVESANIHLNQQLSFFGSAQNQIEGALDFAERKGTQLRQQLSSLEDADLVAAVTDLTDAAAMREAALTSRARVPRASLFNYLA